MNSVLANRERLVLEKYILAEDIRNEKKAIQDLCNKKKVEPKVKLIANTHKLNELEHEVLEAWRQRENRSLKKNKKKEVEKAMDNYLLHLKLRKEIKKQDAKLLKNEKPEGPKVEPLPYLKKFRQKFNNSMQEPDVYDIEDDYKIEPSVMFVHNKKGLQLKAINSSLIRDKSNESGITCRFSPELRSKKKNRNLRYPNIS